LKIEVYYEGDLTVEDTWGDNHGTRYGAQPVVGKVGMALAFDGVNDYMEIPDSPSLDITDEITIEAWIKLDTFVYGSAFVRKGKWASYSLQLNWYGWYTGDPKVAVFGVNDFAGRVRSTTEFVPGVWYHIVGTFDGSALKIYVNGVLEGTRAWTGSITPTTEVIRIGEDFWNHWLDGVVDEVRIYNRALSATEVQDLYNGKRITNGLVSEWGFEDDPRFGQATYEFENSANQYYGLQNINDSWLALFNPTANILEYLILNQRPLGL